MNLEQLMLDLKASSNRFTIQTNKLKDAWDDLRGKCQEVSAWLEHADIPKEKKPDVKAKLDAAEKILIDNEQYCKREYYYGPNLDGTKN
jgi:hypothetical protein